MTIDWTSLNQQTAAFTTLSSITDPVSGTVTVVCAGLQAKLSDVIKLFPAGGGYSVTIYVDTLVIDAPKISATGIIIVARSADVAALNGAPLQISVPASDIALAELLIGGATGGNLALTPFLPSSGGSSFAVPMGINPLQAVLYTIQSNGSAAGQIRSDAADLQDLASRTWALNSLKASYASAATLMDSADPGDVATAQSMLNWIVANVRTLGTAGAVIPSDYAELYSQAAALLVTLNVAPGAVYVPVLSGSIYQTQIDNLLNVLQSYEDNLSTLDVETDIARAVASVSSTLQGTSQDEIAPLQAQLQNITGNITNLSADIVQLRSLYDLQADQANTDFDQLKGAIAEENLEQFLTNALSLATSVVSFGVDVAKVGAGDVGGLGDGVKDLVSGATSAVATINSMQPPSGAGGDLLTDAKALMQMQQALMISFLAGATLWQQAQNNQNGAALPDSLAATSIDPSLAWDNFIIAADAELSTIKTQIGSGTGSDSAQEAANTYLADLKILAGYGKAIDAKFVAYASQLAQATIVKAQIAAAQNVVARWQQQQAEATSDEEKLAALKGIVQTRADAIKRSVFVAWTYYRASYFFLYFAEPPNVINLDMTAAQMQDAFASISQWVAQLLGSAPDGQHVELPNTNVSIEFDFPIQHAGKPSSRPTVDTDVALLTPAAGGQEARISWNIPLGDVQLRGVLPDSGNVAIWITNAQFFLDEVTPNSRGNVIVGVATSGTYQNGFGPQAGHTFATMGLSGNYAYVAATNAIYSPWSVNPAVYMTPTPYTQWLMTFDPTGGDPSTATRLRMVLTVAYLTSPA